VEAIPNVRATHRYGLEAKALEKELSGERPLWIMSSFGPGLDAPIQLFGGYPLEQSMEELRVQHYLTMAMGNGVEQSVSVLTCCEIRMMANKILTVIRLS
jgi:hypothetical protein